ncbi:pre-mRNA 3'-end-processing factor FIP1-like isoform X1 [Photinus pyralis]|uniref:pre-mRNA 3'-end-processing factor FIP1-like isoform X1 n=1 Tax=Photinus pyralis TaxID=7054 RepID=UPI0012677D6F|nr:pre-mRNA 3'-end-processing factor FIP1-like isoform X1 [Photinus pyralis]
MADDAESDDQWLYGDGDVDAPPPQAEKQPEVEEKEAVAETDNSADQPEEAAPEADPPLDDPPKDKPTENGEAVEEDKQNGEGSDKEDYDEDSDDDVNVVIGDIKTSPTYASLNIKRGGLLTTTTKGDKTLQTPQTGKFTVEEFEHVGLINGIPASEFNLDSLEDKPWRKPGADITDYFNYGFNEDTWRAYCERQKRMRVSESGTGLLPLNAIGMPRGPLPIMNDNSKYAGAAYAGIRKAGPPPGRRMTGSIDVIGGATSRIGVPVSKVEAPKENVIQVMTADRREYSRKPAPFPDMSVPPPTTFEEFHPEYDFNPEPEPFYGGYEPTQDSQWGGNSSWQPQEIKTLTPTAPPGPVMPPAPVPPVNAPMMSNRHPPMPVPSPVKDEMALSRRSKSKEKESMRRERDRSRERDRDRERERSHRRDRSRSRSRRHKSRSRSPSHRSHRKKKSRRHEDSD